MSEHPPLIFRRVLGGLRPVGKAAEDAMAAIGDGPVRVRITRTTGNVRRNALYWAVLGVAAPMLSERLDGDAIDVEMLHKVLKDRRGLVKVVTLPSGDTIKNYDSISFAKMPENERAAYVDWALSTLAKWLSVDPRDLLEEGHAQAI